MKTFCINCQNYLGSKRRLMYTPLKPVPFSDHLCKIPNGETSIWEHNKTNSCNGYIPKVRNNIFIQIKRLWNQRKKENHPLN